MKDVYKEIADKIKNIELLNGVESLLGWDQETKMPSDGINNRAEQMSLLSGIIHEKFTSRKIGRMLRKMTSNKDALTKDQQVNVREWLKDYNKAVRIPSDLVMELAKTRALSQKVWAEAKKKSRFSIFSPILSKMIELKKRQADALGYRNFQYDALLDNYEPGMTIKELDPILKGLRDGLVPIIKNIKKSKKKIDVSFITKNNYPEELQKDLCEWLRVKLGAGTNECRLDKSEHPFTTEIGPKDVRISNWYDEKWFPKSLYGLIHETGHALYELGFEKKYYGTPLACAISLGIHESQSRFWENTIGRSKEFAKFVLPHFKKRFSKQLRGVSADVLYKAVNRVVPSFIRVEADEITYNMHIIIRYEIEKSLFANEIKVKDLPHVWNDLMKKYLGIKPKNDRVGVLQDIHWAIGAFGYFPTYSLGNMYCAQFTDKMKKQVRGTKKYIANGNFKPILKWMRTNIHKHGKRYSASELVKKVTGKPLSAKYLIDHFKDKYSDIYGIKL